MRMLNKKDVVFKNIVQVNKRINKLELIKKKLMKKPIRTSIIQRSLRNVNESLSQLKTTRRTWRKYIVSVKIFTV